MGGGRGWVGPAFFNQPRLQPTRAPRLHASTAPLTPAPPLPTLPTAHPPTNAQVVNTPEVMRVYIGSFWDGPCMNPDMARFFNAEQSDLLRDLHVRTPGWLQ